jgi:hypothetical protein
VQRVWVDSAEQMVGVWDASHQATPLAPDQWTDMHSVQAWEGHLFAVRLAALHRLMVEVYVGEEPAYPLPPPLEGVARLLRAPTGQLLIGGAEDYRSPHPFTLYGDSHLAVAPGNYAVRAYYLEPSLYDAGWEEAAGGGRAGLTREECEGLRHAARIEAITSPIALLILLAAVPVLGWLVTKGELWSVILWFVAVVLAVGVTLWPERRARQDPRWKEATHKLNAWNARMPREEGVVLVLTFLGTATAGLYGGIVQAQPDGSDPERGFPVEPLHPASPPAP